MWTKEEIKQLRKLYKNTPTSELAKQLKRTTSSVQAKAGALGLKKAGVRRKIEKKKTAVKKKTTSRKKTAGTRKRKSGKRTKGTGVRKR